MKNEINLRKIGMMFLILSLVFTGMGLSLGTPVSYAASSDVYVASNGNNANDGTRDNPYATLSAAYTAVSDGGTIYIMDDITLAPPFDMNAAKKITITTDPEAEKTALIHRGSSSGSQTLFGLNSGHLILNKIIIDGGSKSVDGRIFNIGNAKLTIEEDTTLLNNYSSLPGSAILLLNKSSIVEMNAGEISGNKHATSSAVVVNVAGATFKMTGGKIIDNSGGGVDVVKGGIFNLSGNAVITGNKSGTGSDLNVNLKDDSLLTLDGNFTGEAGITAQNRMESGKKFGQAAADGLAGLENLIADNSSLYAVYGANNELLWNAPPSVMIEQPAGEKVFNSKPIFEGTSTAGSTITVEIKDKDGIVVDSPTVTVDADGKWTFTPTNDLIDGEYTVEVTAKKDGKSTKTEKVIIVVDKSELQARTEQINAENLVADDYTSESWEALQQALQQAVTVLNDPAATQEQVTAALTALNNAYDGLVIDSSNVYVASYGNDTTGDGTRAKPYATLSKAHAEVNDGGTVYLLNDITITGVGLNKKITISTAPNVEETAVIKRGQPSGAIETLIGLTKNGQLTLKNIIIDGGFNNQLINGRLINVYEGSKLIIEEGAILRNSNSQYHGSAIQIRDNGSVVEMKGGEIRGNSNTQGAAVLVDTGTQFIMTGGLVTDNIGGGVQSRGGEIVLSGEAYITGNTFAGKVVNVNLDVNKTLILNGAFTGEAGITTKSMAPGTQFGRVTEDGLDSIENLIADSGTLLASYDQNKVLVWRLVKNELSQPSTDGEITGTRPTLSGVTEPFAKVTIKIVSVEDPSFVINEERTADENGNWELPIDDVLNKGAYTITVTANKNNTQSNPVTRQFEVVDKTSLQAKFDEITAENLVETEYTEASWTALDEAMKKAEEVLGNPAATQAEVDKALEDLEKARTALTKKPVGTVDKTLLEAKFDEITAENLVETEYTEASWKALQEAMDAAKDVLDNPAATQEEVNAALTALTKAREVLKKPSQPTPTVDKSKLQAKTEQINSENLVADDYTSESWEELQQALQKAETVLKDPNATQEEVDAALTALTKAREGLKKSDQPTPTVDKTKLQAKVDEIAAENLDEDDYTKDSWRELEKALEKAEAVLGDPNSTQKEVDAALSALKKAREGLKKPGEPTVDKSKLEAKVDEIVDEDLDEDDYTGSSWRKLEKALKQAKDVLADPDATQDEVDEALAELKKARRDLTTAGKPSSGRDKNRDRDKGDAYNVSNPFFSEDGSSVGQQKPSEPTKVEDKNDYTGYMNGYPTGKFDPNRQVTRAEMAMILANTGMINPETSASGTFYDVDNGHWAADAIKRANEAGLMNGYANGTFNPQGGITRAEMATIVYKYLGLTGDGLPNNFNDVEADHWATQIIAAVSESGLMNGYPDGTFHPQKTLTRAETVTIINRLTNKIQLSPVNGQSWPDVPPTHWAYKDIEAATKK